MLLSEQPRTLNAGGKLIDLSTPVVMGILNVTDDSFYSGSQIQTDKQLISRAEEMLKSGAMVLDVGAMSTRPGAAELDIKTEKDRIINAVGLIISHFPDAIISVDTYRSEVARAAFDFGARILNDISGFAFEKTMIEFIEELKPAYVLMHNKVKPIKMAAEAKYDDVVLAVYDYLAAKRTQLLDIGLTDIILDPGFGFSKGISQNFELLRELKTFKQLNGITMVGISRKSMIYKTLDTDPENSLIGTTALHMFALEQGADILRVHDVREASEVIKLWKTLKLR